MGAFKRTDVAAISRSAGSLTIDDHNHGVGYLRDLGYYFENRQNKSFINAWQK
jgi:hypothetical protein